MSEVSEMYDRFFRGSKYEWKWLKRGQLAKTVPAGEAVGDWQRRLADERKAEDAIAPPENPFAQMDLDRKAVASGGRR